MLTRVLLVPFLYSLWYDAVLDWGLNPGPPALEASTLPLGYRGGGTMGNHYTFIFKPNLYSYLSILFFLVIVYWLHPLFFIFSFTNIPAA